MHGIGVAISISFIVGSTIQDGDIIIDCGINTDSNWTAYRKNWPLDEYLSDLNYIPRDTGFLQISIGGLYLMWDITTLAMYIRKIALFKKYEKSDPIAYDRINSILYKVFTCTVFYEIIFLSSLIIYTLVIISFNYHHFIPWSPHTFAIATLIQQSVISLAWTYSMYLMMDHNEDKYQQFLRIIDKSGICWVCCKWRCVVIEQELKISIEITEDINARVGHRTEHNKNKTKELCLQPTNTMTSNVSDKTYLYGNTPNTFTKLSIQTSPSLMPIEDNSYEEEDAVYVD